MKANNFKTALTKVKETLKGKTLNISFMNNGKVENLSFSNLMDFGNAVLNMERLGAGFSFVSVENMFVEKRAISLEEFEALMSRGSYSTINFYASNLK